MRKERTHSLRAVLARIMVTVLVILYASLLPKISIHSASTPTLSVTSQKIPIGGTYNLNITNKLRKATYQWNSDDKRIATVDAYGLVTGISRGKTVITCTIKSEADIYQLQCEITVIKPATVFRIVNKVSVLNLGQKYTVQWFIAPSTSDDEVIWSSNNKAIAAPDSMGRFTTMKEGTVTITGRTLSGKTDSMTFKVIGKEGLVTTQEELENLLKSGANQITLRTAEPMELNIPSGDYSDKRLIVEAPKADINNNGVFASIDIRKLAMNGWTENAIGNQLNILTGSRIVVSPFAKVKIKMISGEGKLALVNYGLIEELVVREGLDINLSGDTRQRIPVTVNAANITMTSSVPLSITCNEKFELVLLSGAEKSLIQASSEEVIPIMKGNYRFKVIVGKGIPVVEHEVIPTPIAEFSPSDDQGEITSDGSRSTVYRKTFHLDRSITEITAINVSYRGKAYTITSSALELLIGLLMNNSAYMSLWMDVETHSLTYGGQTLHLEGKAGSMTKDVTFTGGQLDGKTYTVTAYTNNSIRVVSKLSGIDFTITKSAEKETLIVSGEYAKLSGLTFTVITDSAYVLERSYKTLGSMLITYKGETFDVDASLLSTLDFFISKEGFYLEIWNSTTNTTKNYNGQIVNVSGVEGSSTKTFTFEGGKLDGKAYTVIINPNHTVTIISKGSGVSFTLEKGIDERTLRITRATEGLIFTPVFE